MEDCSAEQAWIWSRRAFVKRAGTVRFVIGPSVDPTTQPPKETNLIVQRWVESKMYEISRIYQERTPPQPADYERE